MNYKSYLPLALFLLLVLVSFFVIQPLLMAIILGALLAYITYPLYHRWQKHFKRKSVPAFLVCALVLAVLIIALFFLGEILIKESYTFYLLAKQKLARGIFADCEQVVCPLKEFADIPAVNYQIQELLKSATKWMVQKGSDFLLALPRLALNLFVVFFTMFYFLRDGERFVGRFSKYLSVQKKHYAQIMQRLKNIVYAVVYGYFLIAFLQGALGALGFFLFGIPSPLFWGMIMGFLALVPYLGTGIVWAPAAIVLLVDGLLTDSRWLMFKGIALFLYGLLIVSGVDNILRPKLIGKKAGIHPVVIMVGILGGMFFFGVMGVIIGPLVLSLTAVIINIYLGRTDAVE